MGPRAGLIGEWEGDGGLDPAFSHAKGEVIDTPYREKVTMKPFGPVDNGSQHLYGLDYRSAMWRGSEENPFHTEVGYGENMYLAKNASTVNYEAEVTLNADGTWSYHEPTMLKMNEFPDLFPHVDHNTLHKVG
ncbi:MAG: heme-binding beta-barrel domain-containing protein [Actinomycetota bacterium]|nr:heme-binding beta-barrel domain-containing protein [Actinomycetota bacterium]